MLAFYHSTAEAGASSMFHAALKLTTLSGVPRSPKNETLAQAGVVARRSNLRSDGLSDRQAPKSH